MSNYDSCVLMSLNIFMYISHRPYRSHTYIKRVIVSDWDVNIYDFVTVYSHWEYWRTYAQRHMASIFLLSHHRLFYKSAYIHYTCVGITGASVFD